MIYLAFSFNPLWKLLIDKGMTKDQLRKKIEISSSTLAKMRKNENISLDILDKLCNYLNCQPGDLMDHITENKQLNNNNL